VHRRPIDKILPFPNALPKSRPAGLKAGVRRIYAGLYYPMIVAGMTFIVGSLLLRETKAVRIWDEAAGRAS
jgi:hypothetical protein